jgi:2-methylisocitrate lyase-like PEP mutase family enzyme
MTNSEIFASLHVPGKPLILYNIWDAGSAKAVVQAGALAVATGSASVAGSLGYDDGEAVPRELVLANAARIVVAVDVPVTIDFEAGYGVTAEEIKTSVGLLSETGAVGLNLEDQRIGLGGLYDIAEQAERLAAAAETGLWVNARTDIFLQAAGETHDDAMVEQALERAVAYAKAGARSFFVPLLSDLQLIEKICRSSPLPINVMKLPGYPTDAELAACGVARISYGPVPWRATMDWLAGEARAVLTA